MQRNGFSEKCHLVFFFFWHNESLLEKSIQTVALCISKAPRRSFKASLKKKKTFIFCCVAFLGARVLTAGFLWPPSFTPIGLIWLARYWCTPVSVRQEVKGLQYNKKSSVMSWLRPLLRREYLKADNRCKRDSPPHGQRFWKLITVLLSGRCFSAAGK